MDILKATQIHKSYRMGREKLEVLKGIDLRIAEGEMVALLGASGAGKSTLLHVLGLLDRPDSGTVHYFDEDVTRLSGAARARIRNQRIGFIFQFYHLINELNAFQNVLLGEMIVRSVGDYVGSRREIKERARALLASVGLADRMRHKPTQLSGGERQRVAIARAMLSGPRLIFADEPTGNLDSTTAAGILDLMWQLNADRGISFLLVTHNRRLAERAHRRIELEDGVIVDGREPGAGNPSAGNPSAGSVSAGSVSASESAGGAVAPSGAAEPELGP